MDCFSLTSNKDVIPIILINNKNMDTWLSKQSAYMKEWIHSTQYTAEVGSYSLLANANGKLHQVLCGTSEQFNLWDVGSLAYSLPPGVYSLPEKGIEAYSVAWGLGAYQFTRYKKTNRSAAKLLIDQPLLTKIQPVLTSLYKVRDWINIPTENMGPSEFANVAKDIAIKNGASFKETLGTDLIKENYTAIHTVGRASDDAPRLLDLNWGNKNHPRVTLVGKGVCFDSGGLDLKPSAYMALMKKDMGGAAHVLGLANMIMEAKLPICLRVLMPVVENVISGNAYRPGDIIQSRQGLTIEVGNTDAEGRIILADALTEAVSEKPELLIDISTLTGAARIALGADVAVVFSNNKQVVTDVLNYGEREFDPIWQLPLYQPYKELIKSTIADINNHSINPYGGAITAALFLQSFVPDDVPWLHFDIMAWNLATRPGRPMGGEAMALRALFSYLKERYSQ